MGPAACAMLHLARSAARTKPIPLPAAGQPRASALRRQARHQMAGDSQLFRQRVVAADLGDLFRPKDVDVQHRPLGRPRRRCWSPEIARSAVRPRSGSRLRSAARRAWIGSNRKRCGVETCDERDPSLEESDPAAVQPSAVTSRLSRRLSLKRRRRNRRKPRPSPRKKRSRLSLPKSKARCSILHPKPTQPAAQRGDELVLRRRVGSAVGVPASVKVVGRGRPRNGHLPIRRRSDAHPEHVPRFHSPIQRPHGVRIHLFVPLAEGVSQ